MSFPVKTKQNILGQSEVRLSHVKAWWKSCLTCCNSAVARQTGQIECADNIHMLNIPAIIKLSKTPLCFSIMVVTTFQQFWMVDLILKLSWNEYVKKMELYYRADFLDSRESKWSQIVIDHLLCQITLKQIRLEIWNGRKFLAKVVLPHKYICTTCFKMCINNNLYKLCSKQVRNDG